MANIGKNRTRWERMDKNHIPIPSLVEQYLITCRTEGKTPATLRGYQEKLRRFLKWCEDATLADFSVEMVREYISYLQSARKYEGHPFNPVQQTPMSAANIRNHVRVLRSFASWLEQEQYTDANVLARLKVPKAPRKVIETLSDEEMGRLFDCLDVNMDTGCRDAAILMLFLDTGLRCSELLALKVDDLHLEEQWLKVMGKGQKERMVPFGAKATKLLQRYLGHFRPEPVVGNQVFLCLDGAPMSGNAIRLMFARLAQRAEVPRLHIHLLRHTFATRYLLNGGDAFSLQRVLGHTTLDMTRRYMDMVAVERAVRRRWISPMDSVLSAKSPGRPRRRAVSAQV